MALFGFVPRRVSFVYKRELHKLPVFGWGLASLGMLSIDRSHGKAAFEHIKEEAPKYFEKGWAIVLFPEGTRTKPGQTVKYKSGGARIAIDTGTPVVPIALNSGRCWPKEASLFIRVISKLFSDLKFVLKGRPLLNLMMKFRIGLKLK